MDIVPEPGLESEFAKLALPQEYITCLEGLREKFQAENYGWANALEVANLRYSDTEFLSTVSLEGTNSFDCYSSSLYAYKELRKLGANVSIARGPDGEGLATMHYWLEINHQGQTHTIDFVPLYQMINNPNLKVRYPSPTIKDEQYANLNLSNTTVLSYRAVEDVNGKKEQSVSFVKLDNDYGRGFFIEHQTAVAKKFKLIRRFAINRNDPTKLTLVRTFGEYIESSQEGFGGLSLLPKVAIATVRTRTRGHYDQDKKMLEMLSEKMLNVEK